MSLDESRVYTLDLIMNKLMHHISVFLGHYYSTNVSQDCALLLVSFNFKNMFSSKV